MALKLGKARDNPRRGVGKSMDKIRRTSDASGSVVMRSLGILGTPPMLSKHIRDS